MCQWRAGFRASAVLEGRKLLTADHSGVAVPLRFSRSDCPGVPGVIAAERQQLFSNSGERDVWQISY